MHGEMCGGSIVHKKYVLTAAKCTAGLYARDVTVWVSDHNRRVGDGESGHEVCGIVQHPDYSGKPNYDNNIALLRLCDSLVFSRGKFFCSSEWSTAVVHQMYLSLHITHNKTVKGILLALCCNVMAPDDESTISEGSGPMRALYSGVEEVISQFCFSFSCRSSVHPPGGVRPALRE